MAAANSHVKDVSYNFIYFMMITLPLGSYLSWTLKMWVIKQFLLF